MAAAPQSSRLDASAPPFVMGMPLLPPPATPELYMYMGPPPAALPPAGFYYPPPVLVAPPAPPCFPPGDFLSCWSEFPPGPCVGMPPTGWAPVTLVAGSMPASPAAAAPVAPQPQLPPSTTAAPHQGRGRRGRRQHFGARPLPRLDVPPRMQRAAAARAAVHSPSLCSGPKGEPAPAKEASPRSVLVHMRISPPDTPPALPPSFPYPELGSPSPPASAPSPAYSVPVPGAGSQAVAAAPRRRRGERAPRRPRRAAAGGGERRSDPKPRRVFDPSSGNSNTSLMIRNIPNAFVNLTTPEAARRLHKYLHGHRWKVNGSGKTCEVDLADVEGLDSLVKNFSSSRFDCGDEEFLPVWFEPPRDGARTTTTPHLVGCMLRRR
ncbi:unnamed protein product [Urochloa humidicola]